MRLRLILLVTGCAVAVGSCRGRWGQVGGTPSPARSGAQAGQAKAVLERPVILPRAYPGAVEALVAAHRQAGLVYAVVPPTFEGTLGPCELGQAVSVRRLVQDVARVTATEVWWADEVAVFEPRGPQKVGPSGVMAAKKSEDLRQLATALGRRGRSDIIAEASRLVGSADGSVRLMALGALAGLEGDFIRNEWPGRVSVFEVMREDLDVQALRWVMEEGGPRGGTAWQLACEILGRARDPYLYRALWNPIHVRVEGTLPLALWAVGRSGDLTAGWALRRRIVNTFTNWTEDQYLAAVSMGRLGLAGELRGFAGHAEVDVRRAAVLGLGLCSPAANTIAALETALTDSDPAVQFLACQSLARLGQWQTLRRLVEDARGSAALRCAALEAKALEAKVNPRVATTYLTQAAQDPDARIRAKVADVLGDLGGPEAERWLLNLAADEERWVRTSAVCALGRLGTDRAIVAVGASMAGEKADGDGLIGAIIGLGRGRAPATVEPLARIAEDPQRDRRLRRYAVLALAKLKDRAGQGVLKSLTERDSPAYLAFALRHLELDTPEATSRHLIGYLGAGDRDSSAAAANRLAELGEGAGVRELLEGFNVFDNSARMMHTWGAIRAEGQAAVRALVEGAGSPRAAIRDAAALALGHRRDASAVDALIRLTSDQSAGVRSAAAQSLGLTGDPRAVPHLIRLAEEDENTGVYCAAIRALRMKDFAGRADVRAAFTRLAGSPRDCGVVTGREPPLAAQPANSFVLRRYAQSLDDVTMCNVTYESSLTYDSGRERVVLWGSHGRRADSPQTGQTWFYDARANTWTRLADSREWPNGTCLNRGTTYDPANQVVVSPKSGGGGHGWVNALRANLQWSVPWVLDTKTDEWYPARPPAHQGNLGQVPGSFDPRHGVITWYQGRLWVYDAYANAWTRHRPVITPPASGGCAFDPKTGRLIAGDPRSTWAYDPVTNTWTDLKPDGPTPRAAAAPMVYDSTNDVMLAFSVSKGGAMGVWVYHLRENRWEEMPEVFPSPHYGTLDITFDEANNVTVISGGWQSGRSGETTVRETWTYRYQPAGALAATGLAAPRDVAVTTKAGGEAAITWKAPRTGTAAGYTVERGIGQWPWNAKWQSIASVDGNVLTVTDTAAEPEAAFYRVIARGAGDETGPPSLVARTAPAAVRWAAALVTEAGVRVQWSAVPAADVVGYHVYRAPLDLDNPWNEALDPNRVLGELKRLTSEPVSGTTFTDAAAGIVGPATELDWPKTAAYVVKAVNAWGQEGGASPVVPALPDAPGPVRVIPWVDGRRLVLWTPGRLAGVRGHTVMRMDDWHRLYVFRWQASPLVECAFYDDFDFPTADRRRYYVSGVDVTGAVGIPSSGAWSHGFP